MRLPQPLTIDLIAGKNKKGREEKRGLLSSSPKGEIPFGTRSRLLFSEKRYGERFESEKIKDAILSAFL